MTSPGVLILNNPCDFKKLMRSQEDLPIIIHDITILKKKFGGRLFPVVMIDTAYKAPNDYFEIPCEGFSFKRIDEYKKK